MQSIDFTKINMEVSIGEFQEVDLSKQVGNLLFSMAETIEEDELARIVYKSQGPIQIQEKMIQNALVKMRSAKVLIRIIKAIENNLKNYSNGKD